MNNKTVTPFGEYGILIKDIRQSNVCKPDMSKLKESEYLFQRGCSFDIYKWDGEGYFQSLKFDGKDYHRISGNKNTTFDSLVPMHIWLNDLEDLQKWLGPYYEAAIACMLAPDNKSKKKTSDIVNDYYVLDQDDITWKTADWTTNTSNWTTNTSNTFNDDVNTKLDNMIQKAKTWKAIK